MDKKTVITSVHYLRGFAALAVLLCHYGAGLKHYETLSTLFGYGQFGVHVFFFISGYVIVLSLFRNNYRLKFFPRFIMKRFVRIDPPYICVIIFTLLTFWVLKSYTDFKGEAIPFIPQQFLAHLLYLIPFTKWPFYNHVFWTLCVEFQFYLLISTLYFLNSSTVYRTIFLILFSLTIFIPFTNAYYLITSYTPIFALGIFTMHFNQERNPGYLLGILFCGLLIFIHYHILIFALIMCALLFTFYSPKLIQPFKFLGDISYSLYITHPLVLIYLVGLKKKIGISDNFEFVVFSVEIFLALFFAYVFYILVEKPSINLSKKITLG